MSRYASVKKYPGRPVFVTHAGHDVCISTHDTYYFAEHARLRAAAIAAHPDAWRPNGTHPPKSAWVTHGGAYRRFLATEQAWYAAYGLTPPTRATFTAADHRWATRRAKYGPTGLTPHGRGRIAAAAAQKRVADWTTRRRHYGPSGVRTPRTHCKHGHAYATHGRRVSITTHTGWKRVCVVCYRAAQRRAYARAQTRVRCRKVA